MVAAPDALSNPIVQAFIQYGGITGTDAEKLEKVRGILGNDVGPYINPTELASFGNTPHNAAKGKKPYIEIKGQLLDWASGKSNEERYKDPIIGLIVLYTTILHEGVHFSDLVHRGGGKRFGDQHPGWQKNLVSDKLQDAFDLGVAYTQDVWPQFFKTIGPDEKQLIPNAPKLNEASTNIKGQAESVGDIIAKHAADTQKAVQAVNKIMSIFTSFLRGSGDTNKGEQSGGGEGGGVDPGGSDGGGAGGGN